MSPETYHTYDTLLLDVEHTVRRALVQCKRCDQHMMPVLRTHYNALGMGCKVLVCEYCGWKVR